MKSGLVTWRPFFALKIKASTMTKFYTLCTFLLLLLSCKSATKAFNRGNYTEAIEISVRKLQKDPDDAAAQNVLQQAYRFAVNQLEEKIKNVSSGHNESRWEEVYHEYVRLQQLYESIRVSPAAFRAAKPVNYTDYIPTYRDKATDARIEKGKSLMNSGRLDKSGFRRAYYEFIAALRLKPNDYAIRELVREAKDSATVDVVLLSVNRNNGYPYSNYYLHNFQNDLVRNLNSNTSNEFVAFYSEWDARAERIRADEVLDLRLGLLLMGRPYDETDTREVFKEIAIKEIVYKKDSVVREYAKVYARITTTRRTLVSHSDMKVDAQDAGGYRLWSDQVQGEYRWQTEFSHFTGDERALSESDKALINRSQSQAPSDREITEHLLRQMQIELSYRLRRYYRGS